VTAPRPSALADVARSIPWRLLLPSAVVLVAAWLNPASELHKNQSDVGLYLSNARSFAAGLVPYRDFPLEYPPLALVPMTVPYLLWPFGLVTVEDYAWRFVAWEAVLLFAVAILAARIVRLGGNTVGDEAGGDAGVGSMANRLVVVTIGASLAIAFRFDLFPALLVMVALWATLEDRPVAAGVAIGLGVLAKLYPIAVVPALALAWLVPFDPGRLLRLGLAVALAIVLGMLPFVVLGGRDAFGFLSYLADRGLQVESLGGGLTVLLGLVTGARVPMSFGFSAVQVAGPFADAWLAALPVATAAGFGLLGMLGIRHLRRGRVAPATIVTFAFAAILILLATSKVFSIQYVVWIVPFAALLRGGKFWLAAALIALTIPIHPVLYSDLVQQKALPILLLNARNALFVVLTAWVLWGLAVAPGSAAPRRSSTRSD
jgi:hypothetical protein